MADFLGFRLVAYPRPGDDVTVPYSSLVPDVEGSLVTEPNAGSVAGPMYVFDDFARLALNSSFTATSWFDSGITYSTQRLLVVTYDGADVIDTKDLGNQSTRPVTPATYPATYVRDPLPWHRYTVSAAVIGDEFSNSECCVLASLAPAGSNSLAPDSWEDILATHGA